MFIFNIKIRTYPSQLHLIAANTVLLLAAWIWECFCWWEILGARCNLAVTVNGAPASPTAGTLLSCVQISLLTTPLLSSLQTNSLSLLSKSYLTDMNLQPLAVLKVSKSTRIKWNISLTRNKFHKKIRKIYKLYV